MVTLGIYLHQMVMHLHFPQVGIVVGMDARPIFIIFLIFCVHGTVLAQPEPDALNRDTVNVEDQIDRVLDGASSPSETSSRVAETLSRLAEDPLNVNRAPADELSAIPQLSPRIARRLVDYRTSHGEVSTLNTLLAIDGIDRSRLLTIRPFLVAAPVNRERDDDANTVPSTETLVSNLDVTILQRATRELGRAEGYEDDTTGRSFRGPPGRLTTRIRLGYERQFEAAVTLDKDPGEALEWQPDAGWYGFDHLAGNFTLHDVGPLETLVLGHFAAEFGQGLSMWQGLGFGKGRDPVSPLVRDGRGLVPFQSSSENGYFQGVASTISLFSSLSASAFVSSRRRDATIDSSETKPGRSGPLPVKTLSSGGMHRTGSELSGRNLLRVRTAGGALEYRTSTVVLGATGYHSWFDRPLLPPDQPYRRFDVSGRNTSMASIYGNVFFDHSTLFAEVARTRTGCYGVTAGASVQFEEGVRALLMSRRFPPSFRGLYSSALGERGGSQNETGIYLGVGVPLTKNWRVKGYVDQYRFPWVQFSVPRPARGVDGRVVVEYDPRPWLSTYLQARAEREEVGAERTGPGGRKLAALETEARQSARWHVEYSFSEKLTLRTRLQVSRFEAGQAPASYGTLLSQGIHVQPTSSLSLDGRLALFDTEGYGARIYAHEHDLLYSFSVPVFSGQGQRSYILVQYEPTGSLTLEAKYGVTWYPHRQKIGSGLNATDGNVGREVRLQVRWSV